MLSGPLLNVTIFGLRSSAASFQIFCWISAGSLGKRVNTGCKLGGGSGCCGAVIAVVEDSENDELKAMIVRCLISEKILLK